MLYFMLCLTGHRTFVLYDSPWARPEGPCPSREQLYCKFMGEETDLGAREREQEAKR